MKKARPMIGDRLWRVEWVSKLAFYDESEQDIDRDECTTSTRCFKTREAARVFAEKTWPTTTDKFGIVEVTEIEFVPYDEEDAARYPWVGFWEDVSDSEIFSGEWE